MSGTNSKLPRDVDLPIPIGSDEAKIIAGPENLSGRELWREQLNAWKTQAALRIKYDDSLYSQRDLGYINAFNVALIWLWDELLFDFETNSFTPEKLVADSQKFGGFDGIILWHAYPVIGIDSRNQFDFYLEVPEVAKLIVDLQQLGVKVYLNYNPWDQWTHRPVSSDQEELANLVKKYGFEGVFLDTMKSVDPDFMGPIVKANSKIILAGESSIGLERICDHAMSWAQWFQDSPIPGVIRAKWFEPRHMVHQTRRWNRSHIDELKIAWLNGAGMLLWEVVFGSWVGWNRRETMMWKEMVEILRRYSNLISDGQWEPLSKLDRSAEDHGIYASKFCQNEHTLYTIFNTNQHTYSGAILGNIAGSIPAHGAAAIIIDETGGRLIDFTYDALDEHFPDLLPERLNPVVGKEAQFIITYRNRECGLYEGAAFVDAWKPLPPNFHEVFDKGVTRKIRSGQLENYEITNAQFHEFIISTNYSPTDTNRFLIHWDNGAPKESEINYPVTFVDLADAFAYAEWKGLSIPTEWEWQAYAAYKRIDKNSVWNLTDSVHSDGRTRFLVLKGGSEYNIRNGQGMKSKSGIAEADWYMDGGFRDETWVEKLLLMGHGLSRSENISFTCFVPKIALPSEERVQK